MAPGEMQRPRRGRQPRTMRAERTPAPSVQCPGQRPEGHEGQWNPAPTSSSQPAALSCSGASGKGPISTSYHPTTLDSRPAKDKVRSASAWAPGLLGSP